MKSNGINIYGSYIVIRHSIREKITDVNDSYRQRLTDEGIELAKHLGHELSNHSDRFVFYYSPVPRCEETAISIKEGIESKGKQVLGVQSYDSLGGFFNKDFKQIAELCNRVGGQKYLKMWFENEVSEEVVMPCNSAANYMFNEITGIGHKRATKIFITHDWNIFCLQSLFTKSINEMVIPDYLEGIIISHNKKNIKHFKQEHILPSAKIKKGKSQ